MNLTDVPTSPMASRLIPLASLRFDPQNPRLPPSVDGSDLDAVLSWMLRDASLVELIGSIGEQGYFLGEPILVTPLSEAGVDAFVVVEGNRRLAAVLLLSDPTLAPVRKASVQAAAREAKHRPHELPAIAFPTRDEILDYLGYRHVTGVKQWNPLAKARYVRQLKDRAMTTGTAGSDQQLARMIGSRSDYVRKLLIGLDVYDHIVSRDFYGLRGVDEDAISFSVLTTALSYENIAKWIGIRESGTKKLNDETLRSLVDWTFRPLPTGRTVVGESRNLKRLAAVVVEPRAIDALKGGRSLEDAALFTDEPLDAFREAVEDSTSKALVARDMTHRLPPVADSDVDSTRELAAVTRELHRVIRDRREEQDEG